MTSAIKWGKDKRLWWDGYLYCRRVVPSCGASLLAGGSPGASSWPQDPCNRFDRQRATASAAGARRVMSIASRRGMMDDLRACGAGACKSSDPGVGLPGRERAVTSTLGRSRPRSSGRRRGANSALLRIPDRHTLRRHCTGCRAGDSAGGRMGRSAGFQRSPARRMPQMQPRTQGGTD